jgi:hypothetical protein
VNTLRLLVAGLAWGASVLMEGGALRLIHAAPQPDGRTLATFAGLHGISILLVMGAVSQGRGEPFFKASVEGFLTLAVPLLGAVTAGVILFLGALFRGVWKPSEGELRQNYPPGGILGVLAKEEALRIPMSGLPPLPLAEVMNSRDVDRVEEALVDLAQGTRAEDIDVLKTLLSHPEPEIRLRAHILLVETQDRVIGLLAKAGEEARTGDLEAMKRAGRACFLLSRIASDAETFSVFARESVDWFLQAYRLDPRDSEMLLDLGKANLMAGALNAARLYFQDFIERHPRDMRGYVAHAECSFRLGDRESLQADCAAILAGSPPRSPERATAEFLMASAGGTPA